MLSPHHSQFMEKGFKETENVDQTVVSINFILDLKKLGLSDLKMI